MMDKVVMWQAVVYADDTNTPEILPGLHPTSAEAMAQAEAVMDAQRTRRWKLTPLKSAFVPSAAWVKCWPIPNCKKEEGQQKKPVATNDRLLNLLLWPKLVSAKRQRY